MHAIRDTADYWKDPAVPTPVMQAAAPEFAPVFPEHCSLKVNCGRRTAPTPPTSFENRCQNKFKD